MSSFKQRTNKVKFANDTVTMNEYHQNYVNKLYSNKNLLPEKKQLINELNLKLEYSTDIDEKSAIKNKLSQLTNDISNIENNNEYFEYVSKVGDILLDYYNNPSGNTYNINNSNEEIDVNQIFQKQRKNCEEDLTETTKSIDIDAYIFEETDKLEELNNFNKNTKKREVKKRNIENVEINTRTIYDFFNIQQPTVPKNDEICNRATLQHKYLMKMDKNYACGKTKAKKQLHCVKCNNEMILHHLEGCYICNKCGEVEYVIMDVELPNNKELANEKQKYPYKKINHMKEKLTQFQAIESATVPEESCNFIRNELRRHRIDPEKCQPEQILKILKRNKLIGLYEHLQQIYCKLTGAKPMILETEIKEEMYDMFQKMQTPYRNHRPPGRSNFLNYSFVINKLFHILKKPKHANFFPMLKSKDKLRTQEQIWKLICADLGWEFIPSF